MHEGFVDESHQLAEEDSEVHQCCSHTWVFGAKTLFSDFQRKLIKWNGLFQLTLHGRHQNKN